MDNLQIEKRITDLEQGLRALNDEFYRNNFSAKQDFTKASNFTTTLKVPHYVTAPVTVQAGELIEVNGKLMVSTGATFVIVGSQS